MYRRIYVNQPNDESTKAELGNDFADAIDHGVLNERTPEEVLEILERSQMDPAQARAFRSDIDGIGMEVGTAFTSVGLPEVVVQIPIVEEDEVERRRALPPDENGLVLDPDLFTVQMPAMWAIHIGSALIQAGTASIADAALRHIGIVERDRRIGDPDTIARFREARSSLTDVARERYSMDQMRRGNYDIEGDEGVSPEETFAAFRDMIEQMKAAAVAEAEGLAHAEPSKTEMV